MNATRNTRSRSLAGLLGAALLLSTSTASFADQGKWWTPSGKVPPGQAKKAARAQAHRPVARPYAVAPRYYAPVGRYQAVGPRYWRPYGGNRVYRDVVTVGPGHYAPVYFAPGTPVYRYYAYPTYYYQTRTVYVRPVRFMIAASGVVGGVSFSAGYSNPGYYYGCNFCSAQFGNYGSYCTHVTACPAGPHGYRVVAQNWNGSWQGGEWQDQAHWSHDDDNDRYGHGDQDNGGYDQGPYDNDRYDNDRYDN